ncbi:sodium-coupled monocarboxylate transporter 1-like [Dermacentor variabilis]|uniref:sodium-coupled monocarboxylate transporter 1-like n=1 Tax=Dermacentor variabilis TaxID=34621 RepID=UPI003F5B41DE
MNGDARIRPLSEILNHKYLFNFRVDFTTDETVWAVLIATAPTFINRICLDQASAQRYFATRTQKDAKWTVIVGTIMTCVFSALVAGVGAALICRYRGCDPVLSGSIERFDQLLPFYLLEDLSTFPGLAGVFLAGVVSASISTVSSLVNSQAAVWHFDVLAPFCKVGSYNVDVIIKVLAFAVGGVMTGCSVLVPYLGSVTAMFMAVNSAITGPFVGLVVLGLTAPFANSKGAGVTTLLMVVYQLVHMSLRINSGVREERMPVSLEFCGDNVTTASGRLNITLPTYSVRSISTFPLLHLSSFWSSLFSTVVTYVGGLAISICLGGTNFSDVETKKLTSNLLFPLWRLLRLMPAAEKNIARQETAGMTPFSLVPGREATTKLDIMLPQESDDIPTDVDDFTQRAEEARQLAHLLWDAGIVVTSHVLLA